MLVGDLGVADAVAAQARSHGWELVTPPLLGPRRFDPVETARSLRERGVDVSHLQSDPDLATGRLVIRALGGATLLDAHAAYDQLQWDFDLADIAQGADAVVFGALIMRSGQARSAVDRFLDECKAALRVFDLTNRPEPELSRGHTLSGLRHAEVAVVDDFAIQMLLPGAGDRPPQDAIPEILQAVDAHARYRLRQWLCCKHKVPGAGTSRFPDEFLHETLGLVRLTLRTRNFPWAKA